MAGRPDPLLLPGTGRWQSARADGGAGRLALLPLHHPSGGPPPLAGEELRTRFPLGHPVTRQHLFLLLMAVVASIAASVPALYAQPTEPIVIAHRGASAYRPEHTLAAYELAIEQGADFVEPDLVATKDGALIARHEPYLGGDNPDFAGADSTDVASRPEFAERKRTLVIDGVTLTGWFASDFTLAEIRTLRARERLPALRPGSAAHDGRFAIPTLEDIIALVRAAEARTGRIIGLYPETKHPHWHTGIGLPLEERLVAILHANGFDAADDAVFIQSFEVGNLQRLNQITRIRLVQLMGGEGAPADWQAAGDRRGYDWLASPEGLAFVATYADAIGPNKGRVIPVESGRLGAPTRLVADAHNAGLLVHPYTFRPEDAFLPTTLAGDDAAELRAFLASGVDGLFADAPDRARAAMRSDSQ